MKIINNIKELREELRKEDVLTGFVPTMGFLHEGHLSLIEKSVKENKRTVCSIFVNPTQFGPGEDLDKYPVNITRDISLLEKKGCDLVFIPDRSEMYLDQAVYVDIERFGDRLCGEKRPGHFRGVLTVVCKLFNIVRPHNAYFGEKDYQQLLIIRKMCKDLDFDINIRAGKIVREEDGLAKSSRNSYLSPQERKESVLLFSLISFIKETASFGMNSSELFSYIDDFLNKNMNKDIMRKDYIEILDEKDLSCVKKIDENSRVFLAFYCGKTRLIDNSKILES